MRGHPMGSQMLVARRVLLVVLALASVLGGCLFQTSTTHPVVAVDAGTDIGTVSDLGTLRDVAPATDVSAVTDVAPDVFSEDAPDVADDTGEDAGAPDAFDDGGEDVAEDTATADVTSDVTTMDAVTTDVPLADAGPEPEDAEADGGPVIYTRVIGSEPGVVTAVGTPMGTATTAMIGPAGGSLTSSDGRMTLTIPAGALTTTLPIGIQPITNMAPQGMGLAYRLTPNGTVFATPATATLTYTATDVQYSAPQQIGLAYQLADGTWTTFVGGTLNTAAQTVSIPIPHFTDWSWFVSCAMYPPRTTTILTSSSTAQSVSQPFTYSCITVEHPVDGEATTLLSGPGAPFGPVISRLRYVWTVNDGSFDYSSGAMGGPPQSIVSYVAPNAVPTTDPVRITCTLTSYSLVGGLVLGTQVGSFNEFVLGRHWQAQANYNETVNTTAICDATCPGSTTFLANYEMDCVRLNFSFYVAAVGSGFSIVPDTGAGALPQTCMNVVSGPATGSTSCCARDFSVTLGSSPGNNQINTVAGSVDPTTDLMSLMFAGTLYGSAPYTATLTADGSVHPHTASTIPISGGPPPFVPMASNTDTVNQMLGMGSTITNTFFLTALDPM